MVWAGDRGADRRRNAGSVLSRRIEADGVIHVRFSNDGDQNWSDADHALDGSPIAGFPISFEGDDAFEPYLYVAPSERLEPTGVN